MCREWLCRILNCYGLETNISPPNYLEEIEYAEVFSVLSAEFPNCSILLGDNKYKTTTKEELMRFLKEDNTDKYPYITEWYDCENFSDTLMGRLSNPDWGCLPFGTLWTSMPNGAHAVNVFVDNNREVWIVEPQNDGIFSLPNDWNPYFVKM